MQKDPDLIEKKGKATPHSLRDTFATRLVRRNMSLYKVSKLLGHATMEIRSTPSCNSVRRQRKPPAPRVRGHGALGAHDPMRSGFT